MLYHNSSVSILDGHIIKLSEVILYQNVLIRDFVPHKIRILCVNQDP